MPLSREFKVTMPLPLIALALVTLAVSVIALARARRQQNLEAPPPIGPTTHTSVAEWKDRAPIALKHLFGRIEIHPPTGSAWYLTGEDSTAGDLLIAAADSGLKAGDSDISARAGSRFRIWQSAAAPVLLLEQGELLVAGAIEIRIGSVVIKTVGAIGVKRTESSLVFVAQRGSADIGGTPLAEGRVAEMKGGVVAPIDGEPGQLLKWVDEARARK